MMDASLVHAAPQPRPCTATTGRSRASAAASVRTRRVSRLQAVPDPALGAVALELGAPLLAIGAAAVGVGGVLGGRAYAYSQMEYIGASMLSNWIPKGGARVIQLGGTTRDLYYYPKDTVQVTVCEEGIKEGLWGQAGIQAAVPVVAKSSKGQNLLFTADQSVDAVVSCNALCEMDDPQGALKEMLRVLKPGAPLVFIERLSGAAPLQGVFGGGNGITPETLDRLSSLAGAEVQYDVALEGLDPHAVGVALKNEGGPPPRGPDEDIAFEGKPRKKTKGKDKKGRKAGFGS